MQIVRPQINADKRKELEYYLLEQWTRAVDSRAEQVDSKYSDWNKNFYGVPAEATRTIPWYKSSNFVVKVVRMFVETYAARTLNLIFATKPLFSVDGYPREIRDGLEKYLDRKSMNEWKMYDLLSKMLVRGPKNGTVVVKTCHVEDQTIDVSGTDGNPKEELVTTYLGPRSRVIPFDDIFFHPITACGLDEVEITFHRTRYTKDMAMRKVKEGKWILNEEDVTGAATRPKDIKREEEREEAGVFDRFLEEVQVIECHLTYAVSGDESKFYSIVALICPQIRKLVDVYYNPYPGNYRTFHLYSPSPREDCIYGESWSEIIGQAQEEVSQIHNDRRNSSFLASAPVFKRKNGSNIPNPSTNWYPGKVWDLDETDDLEIVSLGRDTGDMINEELHVLSLCERLMGIGPIMQGAAIGGSNKGVYNTGGTLAVMGEGNQRQDTNVRDAREVLSDIGKCAFFLQSHFASDDPTLRYLSPEVANAVKEAFKQTNASRINYTQFAIKASSAGTNREVEKASLLQMANFLAQHSKTLLELTPQFIGAQNPVLKMMMEKVMEMSGWMAQRLLAAYNEHDAEGVLPDVRQILNGGGAPAPIQGAGPSGVVPGGTGEPGGPVSPQVLQQISQMAGRANGAPRY